jgi:two-component system LytT family sensor kinase
MNDRRLSGRELFLIFLFWTSLALLSSLNRILDPRGFGFRMSPAAPIAFAFVEAWVWAAATPLIFWLSTGFTVGRSPWLVRVPLLLLAGVAIAIGVYFLLGIAREAIFPVPPRRSFSTFAPLRDIGRFRFVNQLLFYFAILAAGFAREYFLRDQSRQRESAQLQAQLAEARLEALRMQINPHFLFNTLHAISALVERDPAGVRRMIARLSDLLRSTIESRAKNEVPLREEMEFVQRYVEIMEIRFQGRLQVVQSIAPETLDALVPNLILQPLVENAMEHGVSRRAGGGRVEISARRDGDRLVVTVRDNGPGVSEPPRGGIGLSNTRQRLEQLYGNAAAVTIDSAAEGGAIATIVLPFRTEKRDA